MQLFLIGNWQITRRLSQWKKMNPHRLCTIEVQICILLSGQTNNYTNNKRPNPCKINSGQAITTNNKNPKEEISYTTNITKSTYSNLRV